MIIMDLQQILIANIMVQMGNSNGNIEVPMLKHMVLNSIRSNRTKYGAKYGELIIASESKFNWRYNAFPYYKANRKKDRDESTLDWGAIFEGLNEIRSDIREYFPYRIISVDGCEADDVIGTLCHTYGSDLPGAEPILILSGDKDFKQLQTYLNVEQYDPVRNRKMTENDPENFLLEQIIRGDKGDGVPNILSPDNCLVLKQRMGTITAKRMAAFKQSAKSGVWEDSNAERNFNRNRPLIDLKFTPVNYRQQVLDEYESQAGKSRDKIFNYFIKNKMKYLMEFLQDF